MSGLYDWQTLVAGLLGVLGGLIAYRGAIISGRRQVAALREQIEAARQQDDRRRVSVVEWAVRAEGKRLETAVWARKGRALPSGPQPVSSRRREQLLIQSSPLLRGEREDMSLLDDETRTHLQRVADALHRYNACIETARSAPGPGEQPWIEQETLDAIDELATRVQTLQALASIEWRKMLSNEQSAPEPPRPRWQRFKVWRRPA
jgi:hypothetical protein